jgi:WD40 repeat protein
VNLLLTEINVQAIGSEDRLVQMISIAERRVVAVLAGHESEVISVTAAEKRPGLVASLAADGEVRVWDIVREVCVHRCASSPC